MRSNLVKEDNIIVPRWFLEVVEDTLQIQYNINEPCMKETGESCQDRNIRQSLNGIRKLLNGEELTGMERLEKLHPSLPSDIDETAEKLYPMTTTPPTPIEVAAYHNAAQQKLRDAFKAGVKWLAGQGYIEEGIARPDDCEIWVNLTGTDIKDGDKVIVQVRKK